MVSTAGVEKGQFIIPMNRFHCIDSRSHTYNQSARPVNNEFRFSKRMGVFLFYYIVTIFFYVNMDGCKRFLCIYYNNVITYEFKAMPNVKNIKNLMPFSIIYYIHLKPVHRVVDKLYSGGRNCAIIRVNATLFNFVNANKLHSVRKLRRIYRRYT